MLARVDRAETSFMLQLEPKGANPCKSTGYQSASWSMIFTNQILSPSFSLPLSRAQPGDPISLYTLTPLLIHTSPFLPIGAYTYILRLRFA